MIVGTITGVSASLARQHERQQQILGASEMASRLAIIRADDPDLLPQSGLPVAYGDHLYRWSLASGPVRFELGETAQTAEDQTQRGGGLDLDNRIVVVRVNVWLSEEHPGGSLNEPVLGDSVPFASITRMIDPFGFENADQTARRLEGPGGVEGFMADFLGATFGNAATESETLGSNLSSDGEGDQ